MIGAVITIIITVILCIMIIAWGLKKGQENKQAILDKVENLNNQGYHFQIVMNLSSKCFLMVDEQNRKFATSIDGQIHDAKEISSYNLSRPYSLKGKNYVNGIILTISIKKTDSRLEFMTIGLQDVLLEKNSIAYNRYESELLKAMTYLDKITEVEKWELFAKENFTPEEIISHNNQYFAVDYAEHKFAIRTGPCPFEIHPFSDLLRCTIKKDNVTHTTIDFGNAVLGSVIAGKTGAAIMGKSSESYCYDIKVVITIRQDYGVDDNEFELLSNGKLLCSSSEYQYLLSLAEKISACCKYITQHKK